MDFKSLSKAAQSAGGYREIDADGITYTIKLLPATKGLSVATSLARTILPSLGSLADNVEKRDYILPEESVIWTELAVMLVSQLDKIDIVKTVTMLMDGSSADGEPIKFEEYFSGNYGTLIFLVEFALKENFGSFFTGYLKAKGLEIPSLRAIFSKKVTSAEESESELD